MTVKTDDIFKRETYEYNLPRNLIAQYPVEPRDKARLMVLDKNTGKREDKIFTDIIDYLNPGDTLAINKTRVIPARLYGYKDTGAHIEILLLRRMSAGWEALVRPARRLKAGTRVRFMPESPVEAEIVDELPMAGGRLVVFNNCENEAEFIEKVGQMPLPPYIDRPADEMDKENYQTVYAYDNGSAAAPTAGLHFTPELLEAIKAKGVNIALILLHVGLGTFRPVGTADIREHQMHYEEYCLDAETAALLNRTREKGHNIVAVGTTVVRTLETVYQEENGFVPAKGQTNKFIYPGYRLKAIDHLITNFHLPGSSLIMLVAAFAGIENTLNAYQEAVQKEYRFFSYGDAMFIK